MAITDAFRSAVATGDVRGIRIMMKDSLLVDPSFTEFNEMNNLARSVSGLYDPHDGREIIKDSSAWDDNYMNKLMVQVVGNFSDERVDHLKEVVRFLRPVAARPQQTASSSRTVPAQKPPVPATQPRNTNYQEQKQQDERSGRIVSNRGARIASGAVAGGVVGGAIAGFVGGPILIGAAAGAVAVGAVVVIATNER
jgi:hypothetical protein